VGFGVGRFTQTVSAAAAPLASRDNGAAQGRPTDAREALRPSFDLFWEAMNLVYRDYYGTIPDATQMTYNAIRGVVNELGDPVYDPGGS
jgi:hypothetical protein